MAKDWRHLEFFVPIKEVLKGKEDFVIRGVAINETTTRNNVRYKAEELLKAAPSLRSKPILKDHNNSVDSIVGRTTENVYFNESAKRIEFEGVIRDKKMQEMINDGLIGSVSVGAMVHDLMKEESADGEGSYLVAKGIDFVEISLVAVPADPNAGFEKAIMESFKLKEEAETEATKMMCEMCNKEFATQPEMDKHMAEAHSKKEESKVANMVTEKIMEEKMADENVSEALKAQFEEKTKILAEHNATLTKKLAEYAEKEMNALREEYKALATEKGITVKENYQTLTKEVMEVLIDTLKSIKTVEVKETPTKGEIMTPAKVEEKKESMIVEKSDLGKGFSLYAENISEMNSKYKWRD